jgi:hypothetical protein
MKNVIYIENIENIENIGNEKYEIMKIYRTRNLIQLRLNTINTVVKNLIKLCVENNCKLELRKSIISSILYQMISDKYIESVIGWNEYNELKLIIADVVDCDLEDCVYDDYYKSSFCFKYCGCIIYT